MDINTFIIKLIFMFKKYNKKKTFKLIILL